MTTASLKLGRKLLHSGNVSERTIENMGNFSACSLICLTNSNRDGIAPLNLKPSCTNEYDYEWSKHERNGFARV